ncbi:MAG: hypothetical protein JW874_05490 [Spirochaetales bacterium]|nr:hypothetical protein [Spirochaetales bacterium]
MTKKYLFIFLFFSGIVLSSAALDFGVGLNAYLSIRSGNNEAASMDETFIEIEPLLVLRISSLLELDASLRVLFNYEAYSNTDEEVSELGIVGGSAALLFHLLKTKKIDFSTGPALLVNFNLPLIDSDPTDDDRFYIFSHIMIPLVMDFRLTNNLILRLKHEIPVLHICYDEEGSITQTYISFYNTEETSLGSFGILLGLIYMF